MTHFTRGLRALAAGVAAAGILAASGCAASDPLGSGGASGDAIVIGSQDYYSNEIIAELYAQALEAEGHAVQREFRIGQREVYLPEIEQGRIDLFPEYSGPLLQYWQPDTSARLGEEVYAALSSATPDGLRVLAEAPATDQDAFVVTREFADKWGLRTIADLGKVTEPLTLGANSEAETRPNGPAGLRENYGIEVGFTPIEDGGGPLTVKALQDGRVQLAIIYTADPAIESNDLVVLEDPKGLFLASHVVPLASDRLTQEQAAIADRVSAALTGPELMALNARSVEEELPAATIASEWLRERGIVS